MMMESELWNQEGLTHAAQLAFWKDRQVLVCVCSTHKVVRSIYLHVWVNLGVNLCPTEHEAILETWFLEYSQGEIISCFNHPLLSLSVCLSYELGWHYLFPFGMVGTQNKNSMKVPRSWQILLKKKKHQPNCWPLLSEWDWFIHCLSISCESGSGRLINKRNRDHSNIAEEASTPKAKYQGSTVRNHTRMGYVPLCDTFGIVVKNILEPVLQTSSKTLIFIETSCLTFSTIKWEWW